MKNKALARLREYFYSDDDFAAFRAQHHVKVFEGPQPGASRVDVHELDGARLRSTYAHNPEQTRRRKVPFTIEQLCDDEDGIEYVERLDESTATDSIYLVRYLNADGCELRVSHRRDWFLTDETRSALRRALGRPLFPGPSHRQSFAPQTVHDGSVELIFVEMAPRLTLAFATGR